jgi:hypothetical protein
VLAQRASTFGAGGHVTAPAIVDAGRPLEPRTRNAMESSFGRDFGSVRVHDDARAHDDARSLHARSYTAGNHIVFGEGAYRPDTPRGDALIAHELAHSVQQDGIQMKPDGSLPPSSDAELERQADRAALDATAGRGVTGLGRVGRPAIFRADEDPAAAPDAKPAAAAGATADLPSDVEVVEEIPKGPGASYLVVRVPVLNLPNPKGAGPWVQEGYTAMAAGKRLNFQPIFDGKSFDNAQTIKAFKEQAGERYKDTWLGNYGFKNLKDMADAFKDAGAADPAIQTTISEPGVAQILAGFQKNRLTLAGTDIDHVVEKQLGGSSVAGNLQLLIATKNRAAGTNTYAALIAETKRILRPARPNVRRFQIRFADAKVTEDTEDPSYQIEKLLRTPGKIKGSEDVKTASEGTPVQLLAGGASEVVRVRPSGATPIDTSVRALVNGMRLTNYHRTKGSSATKGTDIVEAELAASILKPLGKNVSLTAELAPLPPAAEPASGAAQAEKAAASEVRKLTIDRNKNKDVAFYYPYLSIGRITSLEIDDRQQVKGEGVIKPSVQFLGDLKVRFGPEQLELVQDINVDAINSSAAIKPIASVFRFTNGKVSIDLVKFKPSGDLEFEVGPRNRPVILGAIKATEEGGAFVATGDLKPGAKIPGISEASGQVRYHSRTGWDGRLTAKGQPFSGATADATLGFKTDASGRIDPYATGGLEATIKRGTISMRARWNGRDVSYHGGGSIPRPLPLVREVRLRGSYDDGVLFLEGTAPVEWKNINATAKVAYRKRDGDEGKFAGSVDVTVKTEKAEGLVQLTLKESGKVTGQGKIKYWVTKHIAPELGIEYGEDERLKLFGSVTLTNIRLLERWPSKEGGRITFLKAGAKFRFPTPIPAVTGFGEVYAEAYLLYGVGPVMLEALMLAGELYPFEEDPKVKAKLKGVLAVPADVTLGGRLGAYIGAEIAFGAVGAKGGIDVVPKLTILGAIKGDIAAEYTAGAFSFEAMAIAEGTLKGSVALELSVTLSALWGLLTHRWPWEIGNLSASMDPGLRVQLGKFKYGPSGLIVEADPKPVPADLDTMSFLKGLLQQAKDKDKKVEPPKELRTADDYEIRYHGRMI